MRFYIILSSITSLKLPFPTFLQSRQKDFFDIPHTHKTHSHVRTFNVSFAWSAFPLTCPTAGSQSHVLQDFDSISLSLRGFLWSPDL